MPLTDAQQQTYRELDVRGFHLNRGEPCECGGDDYVTRSEVGYSDYVTYYHHCKACGNRFETYIEG